MRDPATRRGTIRYLETKGVRRMREDNMRTRGMAHIAHSGRIRSGKGENDTGEYIYSESWMMA